MVDELDLDDPDDRSDASPDDQLDGSPGGLELDQDELAFLTWSETKEREWVNQQVQAAKRAPKLPGRRKQLAVAREIGQQKLPGRKLDQDFARLEEKTARLKRYLQQHREEQERAQTGVLAGDGIVGVGPRDAKLERQILKQARRSRAVRETVQRVLGAALSQDDRPLVPGQLAQLQVVGDEVAQQQILEQELLEFTQGSQGRYRRRWAGPYHGEHCVVCPGCGQDVGKLDYVVRLQDEVAALWSRLLALQDKYNGALAAVLRLRELLRGGGLKVDGNE